MGAARVQADAADSLFAVSAASPTMDLAAWRSIKLSDADGGLLSCFDICQVHPEIRQRLAVEEGIVTLRDLASSYTQEDHVVELDKVWQAVENAKAMRRERGRLHSAWKAARLAIDTIEAVTPGGPSGAMPAAEAQDWEAPLLHDEVEQMRVEWTKRYTITVEPRVFPGDPLTNRIYREFRRWATTTTEVGRMKSLLHERQPSRRQETHVSARSSFVENVAPDFAPTHVVDYYFGLRTLANAWGRAGNYEVDSKEREGQRVLMMPWAVGLDYADRALRVTMNSGLPLGELLPWMTRKDRVTRALMSGFVRERWPAGEALAKAIKDTTQDWAVVRGGEVRGPHETLTEGDPALSLDRPRRMHEEDGFQSGRRQRLKTQREPTTGKGGKGGAARGAGGPQTRSKIGMQSSQTSAGKKLCGAFNSKKGCKGTEKNCPAWGLHICGYIIEESGEIWCARKHGFNGHRSDQR